MVNWKHLKELILTRCFEDSFRGLYKMNEKIKLSIIVPVYNVENYLPRCIESILGQSFKDFECILVDDGSTDRSGKICDEYAKKDSRLIVIHKENGGVSSARNAALNCAKGEFITFVDSDDSIELETYNVVFDEMLKNCCNIGIYGFKYITGDKVDIPFKSGKKELLSYKQSLNLFFLHPSPLRRNLCNKVIESSLINQLRFDSNLKYGEDEKLLFQILNPKVKIIYLSNPYYNNYLTSGSATRGGTKIEDVMESIDMQIELLNEYKKDKSLYSLMIAAFSDIWLFKLNLFKNEKNNNVQKILGVYKRKVLSYLPKVIFNNNLSIKNKLIWIYNMIKV